jgi:hypothetical protein
MVRINTATFFLGKNVNVHLKDGSVIVNVQLVEIQRDEFTRKALVKCASHGKGSALKTFALPLKSIAWLQLLTPNLSN